MYAYKSACTNGWLYAYSINEFKSQVQQKTF